MPYLIDENFESGLLPSGVVVAGSGSVNWAATTSPAPLDGSFSMEMQPSSSSQVLYADWALGGSHSVVGCYFLINASSFQSTTTNQVFVIGDGIGGDFVQLEISNNSARFSIIDGTERDNAPSDLVGLTTYHLWLDYTVSGAGQSDGVASLYYSTDGVKPASPQATITGLASEALVDKVSHWDRNRGTIPTYRDNFKVADAFLGDNGALPAQDVAFVGAIANQTGTESSPFSWSSSGYSFTNATGYALNGDISSLAGLSFNTSSGVVEGTPTANGTISGLTITGTGTANPDTSNTFDITISAAATVKITDTISSTNPSDLGTPIANTAMTVSCWNTGDDSHIVEQFTTNAQGVMNLIDAGLTAGNWVVTVRETASGTVLGVQEYTVS